MRLATYSGVLSNLLAKANELGVTQEDRATLCSLLMSIAEHSWSQATRTALYTTCLRCINTLKATGFPGRSAEEICRSIPYEGLYLFAGQAIQAFDDECAYRKRADETAKRLLQSQKLHKFQPPRQAPLQKRQFTVTVPGPDTCTTAYTHHGLLTMNAPTGSGRTRRLSASYSLRNCASFRPRARPPCRSGNSR